MFTFHLCQRNEPQHLRDAYKKYIASYFLFSFNGLLMTPKKRNKNFISKNIESQLKVPALLFLMALVILPKQK